MHLGLTYSATCQIYLVIWDFPVFSPIEISSVSPRKIHFIIKNLEREVQLDPFWGGFGLLLSIRRIYGCLSWTTTLKYPGSVKKNQVVIYLFLFYIFIS